MSKLDGRIGGLTAGYDLHADWDGTRLTGRIGGQIQGKDIRLEVQSGDVDGRVGGVVAGFDVDGDVSGLLRQQLLPHAGGARESPGAAR